MKVEHNSCHVRLPLRIVITTVLVLSPLLAMNEALSCAACGDTLSKDWGTQGISSTTGFSADLSYSYINQNQLRFGTGKASTSQISNLLPGGQEVEDYTTTRLTTASLNYSTEDWSINTQLPYIQRTHGTFGNNLPGDYSTYSTSSDTGIGDIRIIAKYTGYSEHKTSGIIAGLKLPTGSTDANFNTGSSAGSPLDPSLQIGTGSTDLILGGFLSGFLNEYGWFAQGTVQHAVVTKTITGARFRPGDAYALNAGIHHAKFGAPFTSMLQLNFIHRRPDDFSGTQLDGGTLVFIAPGASFRLGGGTSIYGFAQLPVYQNVYGLQLSPRYTFTVGVSHSFE
jgi:hypothetical protein